VAAPLALAPAFAVAASDRGARHLPLPRDAGRPDVVVVAGTLALARDAVAARDAPAATAAVVVHPWVPDAAATILAAAAHAPPLLVVTANRGELLAVD
jgi:hypothetical protein